MAKKKNQNVVIKDEELVPTTIGVYDNKVKSPIGIIILIIAFVCFVIYMPTIQSYINKYLGKGDTNSEPTNNGGNTNPDTPDDGGDDNPGGSEDLDKKYALSSDTVIDGSSYKISNFKVNGNSLELQFTNTGNTPFSLKDYYFEFYSESNTFLYRRSIANDSVQPNNTRSVNFDISSDAKQVAFIKRTESDYQSVELKYNENQEGLLVCTSNSTNRTYSYLFVSDYLSKVTSVYTQRRYDDNYQSAFQEYTNKTSIRSSLEGIIATISSEEGSFVYKENIDLSTADLGKVDDKNVYAFKTTPKEVKFKQEAKGYTCEAE